MVELFYDITPITAENFRGLCTGDYGLGSANPNAHSYSGTKTKLHYQGSRFHRVAPGFCIQGGDFTKGDGSGGVSIYGKPFADEDFSRKHAHAGLLSMANRGPNSNTSQFFLTLRPCPHLDGKHVVFGQVIAGMEIVREIATVPIDANERPRIPVEVFDCGEVDDLRIHLRQGDVKQLFRTEMQKDADTSVAALPDNFGPAGRDKVVTAIAKPNAVAAYDSSSEDEDDDEEGEHKEEDEPGEGEVKKTGAVSFEAVAATSAKYGDRLSELQLRMNQARALNNEAVVEEVMRDSDPNFYRKKKREEWMKQKEAASAQLEAEGLGAEKSYLKDTLLSLEKKVKTAKGNKRNFTKYARAMADDFTREDREGPLDAIKSQHGWDVFNDDAIFRAYGKRVKKFSKQRPVEVEREIYKRDQRRARGETVESDEEGRRQREEQVALEIRERMENRKDFSRRRTFMEDEEVNYINERNRVFNKKIQRHFQRYAHEMKANLERGSAL